jgi:hypothetical protein
MELFGLKDKDGKEYKIVTRIMSEGDCDNYEFYDIINIEPMWPGPIESPPKSKELPKTVEDLKKIIHSYIHYYIEKCDSVENFLKEIGYDMSGTDEEN